MYSKHIIVVAAVILVMNMMACATPANVIETPRVENTRDASATATLQIESTRVATPTIAPTQPASPLTGTLAFASDRDNAAGIYLTTLDGVVTRLSREKYDASHPAWSPDGKRIAFDARVNGREELFVMDADGANVRQLTRNQGDNFYPTWSPDSQQIAVASNRDGAYQIYPLRADGSDVRRLATETVRAEKPAWSPDGTQIAFYSNRDGNPEVYVMDADSENVRRLTNGTEFDGQPTWKPTAKKTTLRDKGSFGSASDVK